MPDDLYELMRCVPSTRYFIDEPVGREVLERVFENARFAPSGGNRQGWRVIVVTDRPTDRPTAAAADARALRAAVERLHDQVQRSGGP